MTARVELRGINQTKKTLATGEIVIYYYAWKGGLPLKGKKGSPEWVTSYWEAWAKKTAQKAMDHLLRGLIRDYKSSRYFTKKLKPQVQKDNGRILDDIADDLGDLELKVFALEEIEIDIEEWRDDIHERSPSTANRYLAQLSAALTWGEKRRRVARNPCTMIESRYSGSRVDFIWREKDEERFLAKGPVYFHLAFILAIWTGQREGDLVALKWSQYDGEYLYIEQIKGRLGRERRKVEVYVGKVAKAWLDATKLERGIKPEDEDSTYILLNSRGEPWAHPGSFATGFSQVTDGIGILGLTFHDLRRTAVTRLFRAGNTAAQIATITGHSLKTVDAILDKHYFHRDRQISKEAQQRREEYENRPTALPTEPADRRIRTGNPR